MPLIPHPIAFAALAVIAIGVITYQILNKQKRRYPENSRRYSRDTGYGSEGSDIPDKGPRGPPGYASNGSGGQEKTDNGPRESKTRSSDPSTLRKRTNAAQELDDTSGFENLAATCSDSKKYPDAFTIALDRNPESPGNLSRLAENTNKRNNEVKKINGDFSQVNHKSTDFVANINDEDSDSSESNNSLNSFETNITSTVSNGCIRDNESSSTTENTSTRFPSFIDSDEEIYKREVCGSLKSDIESENFSSKNCEEKLFKKVDDRELDVSKSEVSSDDSCFSGAFPKKPMICKGCEDDLANAVAIPCKHCYLCLDCAFKVHRIYNKCTVCHTVIKTYERLER